ncbi:MAG: hypothetical protein DRH79_02380 [Candidatus Cloacimonadota bacterium]|nr:MAG: hypothetical protein DRH79_02380 [Candidatus Cloacimonadota bacterium]
MKYLIFGKIVEITIDHPADELIKIDLEKGFSLYSKADESKKTNIKITICQEFKKLRIISQNPSVHQEIENGFIAKFLKYDIAYQQIDDQLIINIKLKTTANKLLKYLKKVNNIEYENIEGRISSVIHEMALIPATYFFDDLTLIHSSTFTKNDSTIMVGGTGGCGKTSLCIELCMNHGFKFVNDDIAVIDATGKAWPNLAFPKIYGYNLVGNKKLSNLIFKDREMADRIIWKMKYSLLGADKVRRKISPVEAFGGYQSEPVLLTAYYLLSRVNTENISIKDIEAVKAAEISTKIIQQEYFAFNNHILWHEVNCRINNTEPILKLSNVFDKMEKLNKKVINKLKCKLIQIPIYIKHQKYISEVSKLIR